MVLVHRQRAATRQTPGRVFYAIVCQIEREIFHVQRNVFSSSVSSPPELSSMLLCTPTVRRRRRRTHLLQSILVVVIVATAYKDHELARIEGKKQTLAGTSSSPLYALIVDSGEGNETI